MDDWNNNLRREYAFPCLITFIICLGCILIQEFTETSNIINMIETISFSLTMYLFFLFINLSYLMNRN